MLIPGNQQGMGNVDSSIDKKFLKATAFSEKLVGNMMMDQELWCSEACLGCSSWQC
jgi:hypothetical protein